MSAKIICAWCGKILGSAPELKEDTHGICQKCSEEQRKLIAQMKRERRNQ